MIVTELGFDIVDVLHKHATTYITQTHRDLEEKMDYIQSGDGKRESVLSEAIERLTPVLTEMKQQEQTIGEALSAAIGRNKLQEQIISWMPQLSTRANSW